MTDVWAFDILIKTTIRAGHIMTNFLHLIPGEHNLLTQYISGKANTSASGFKNKGTPRGKWLRLTGGQRGLKIIMMVQGFSAIIWDINDWGYDKLLRFIYQFVTSNSCYLSNWVFLLEVVEYSKFVTPSCLELTPNVEQAAGKLKTK